MRVVHVTYTDFEGRRFNGFDLRQPMMNVGVDSQMLVWEKQTVEPWVSTILPGSIRHKVKGGLEAIESAYSLQSMLYPFPLAMMANDVFRLADVAHYQMIHNSFYSLRCLPLLTKKKPTVWSLHDPWPLTGHCIHPYDCHRWETGCGECDDLGSPKKMRGDNTHRMWGFKKQMYARSEFEIVVASEWMEERVHRSPLMEGKRVHRIPIGVDLERFKPQTHSSRKDTPGSVFTLMLRASSIRFKGLEYIKRIVGALPKKTKFRLLCIDEKGLLNDFKERHEVVDLGRVDDAALIAAYQQADVFLMPSTAESYGMMAVEAAACGVPTVCLKGTAVEEVVSPSGLAFERNDVDSAIDFIVDLAHSDRRLAAAREKARASAEGRYDIKEEAKTLERLYEEVAEKKGR